MRNQTLIQIRVDMDLKDQVTELYEQIGIDIPTAIRMFLKASVKEQGLPFTATVRDENEYSRYDNILSSLNKIEEILSTQPVSSATPASESISNSNSIVVMPLEYGMDIPMTMYIQLISKVPCGCITCWRDINDFLGKLYGRPTQERSRKMYPPTNQDNNKIPYWRVVSHQVSQQNKHDLGISAFDFFHMVIVLSVIIPFSPKWLCLPYSHAVSLWSTALTPDRTHGFQHIAMPANRYPVTIHGLHW